MNSQHVTNLTDLIHFTNKINEYTKKIESNLQYYNRIIAEDQEFNEIYNKLYNKHFGINDDTSKHESTLNDESMEVTRIKIDTIQEILPLIKNKEIQNRAREIQSGARDEWIRQNKKKLDQFNEEQLKSLNLNNAQLYLERGKAHAGARKHTNDGNMVINAINDFNKAIELGSDETKANSYFNLAQIESRTEVERINDYQRALENGLTGFDKVTAHFQLAISYLTNLNENFAFIHFQAALDTLQQFPDEEQYSPTYEKHLFKVLDQFTRCLYLDWENLGNEISCIKAASYYLSLLNFYPLDRTHKNDIELRLGKCLANIFSPDGLQRMKQIVENMKWQASAKNNYTDLLMVADLYFTFVQDKHFDHDHKDAIALSAIEIYKQVENDTTDENLKVKVSTKSAQLHKLIPQLEQKKYRNQAIRLLNELEANKGLTGKEKADHSLECIDVYKKMENNVKESKDETLQCEYYSGLINIYSLLIRLNLKLNLNDYHLMVDAYAARGMAYKILASYSHYGNRGSENVSAAANFSQAIQLLQENNKSGFADKKLQEKIAELCFQRAYVNTKLNAVGRPIINDCLKYLANFPYGPNSYLTRVILINNLNCLFDDPVMLHRSHHDNVKKYFLNDLQDNERFSIEEQEQLLILLMNESQKDTKNEMKDLEFSKPVNSFFLKHPDTLKQIKTRLKNLQKMKKMAAQNETISVVAGASNFVPVNIKAGPHKNPPEKNEPRDLTQYEKTEQARIERDIVTRKRLEQDKLTRENPQPLVNKTKKTTENPPPKTLFLATIRSSLFSNPTHIANDLDKVNSQKIQNQPNIVVQTNNHVQKHNVQKNDKQTAMETSNQTDVYAPSSSNPALLYSSSRNSKNTHKEKEGFDIELDDNSFELK